MAGDRIQNLLRLMTDHPDDPRLHFGLAVEYLNRGETLSGAESLRRYLALAEDEGNGWGRLGEALAELGEMDEAREAYSRGVEIARARGHEALAEELREAMENLP